MINNLINKLSKKSNKDLVVKPVFHGTKDFDASLSFLRSQKFIDFKKIENILKIKFLKSEPLGNILINEKKEVVGFLGTIFGERYYKDNLILLCNLHSWIVEKKYRYQSFQLLIPIIRRNILIFTFSPIKSLEGLYEKLGFKKKIICSKLIFFIPYKFIKKRFKYYSNNVYCEKFLSKSDLKIFKDYNNERFINLFFFDTKKNEHIYLVVKKTFKKTILPVIEIIYVSNIKSYYQNFYEIKLNLFLKFKTFFIVQNYNCHKKSFFYKKAYCLNFSSDLEIDLLYSELS